MKKLKEAEEKSRKELVRGTRSRKYRFGRSVSIHHPSEKGSEKKYDAKELHNAGLDCSPTIIWNSGIAEVNSLVAS